MVSEQRGVMRILGNLGEERSFKEWFDLECHDVDSTNGIGKICWIELESSREESIFFKKGYTHKDFVFFRV